MTDAVDPAEMLARLGRALADPLRRRILLSLRVWPATTAELADELGEAPSTVAGHLACMRGCGLVVIEPQENLEIFELTNRYLDHAIGDLIELTRAPAVSPRCSTENGDHTAGKERS